MTENKNFDSGFLPDDYVAKRAERRMTVLAVTLFVLVMFGVTTAFVVTQRNWTEVRSARTAVNQRFVAAADRIAEMDAYETRVSRMVDKAHVAVGLVDTVPRSNLLAELVRQMPTELSLMRVGLETDEIKPARPKPSAVATLGSGRKKRSTDADAEAEAIRPEPRRWASRVTLEGLAPSLDEVSRFIDALVKVEIFRRVRLDHTQEKEIEGRPMREYRILFEIDPDADIRETRSIAGVVATDMEDGR